MDRKNKCLVILSLIFILLIPSLISANKGMISVDSRIGVEESGQNAIVAWNGEEEIIILSTEAKSSDATLVLEVLPLPSNPTKVKEGSFDSFTKIAEIIDKKRASKDRLYEEAVEIPGVQITFQKKVGAHDVTVVKVNNLDYFINWVKDFIASKGFKQPKISLAFKNTVENYLNRNMRFFVFDVIETSKDKQSIKPLIYRFKTDFLYYPLEITATSDAGGSISQVNIFLIAKGRIKETIVSKTNLWTEAGFDSNIELAKEELKEVNPELEDLFKSTPLVMYAYYDGHLDKLNKDLIAYRQDIQFPSIFEKISKHLSTLLVFEFLFGIGEDEENFTGYDPILTEVIIIILLFSFIIGIPCVIFSLSMCFKRLFKKYNLERFSLFGYIVAVVIAIPSLTTKSTGWATFFFAIYTIIGFSMMVFLGIKFFKKYVFWQ